MHLFQEEWRVDRGVFEGDPNLIEVENNYQFDPKKRLISDNKEAIA